MKTWLTRCDSIYTKWRFFGAILELLITNNFSSATKTSDWLYLPWQAERGRQVYAYTKTDTHAPFTCLLWLICLLRLSCFLRVSGMLSCEFAPLIRRFTLRYLVVQNGDCLRRVAEGWYVRWWMGYLTLFLSCTTTTRICTQAYFLFPGYAYRPEGLHFLSQFITLRDQCEGLYFHSQFTTLWDQREGLYFHS